MDNIAERIAALEARASMAEAQVADLQSQVMTLAGELGIARNSIAALKSIAAPRLKSIADGVIVDGNLFVRGTIRSGAGE